MASTIKVNSITAQSGTDVNVPTGFKLKVADAGELYVGGNAITTGATQVTSRTADTTIGVGSGDVDITGKSLSVISVDASSGTSTTITVTLPVASTFATTAIRVVSAAAHGAGNKIVINKHATDGGGEVFTLYEIRNFCELVSDGTNVLRTGTEQASVRGRVALTADASIPAETFGDVFDIASSSSYSVEEDLGGCWSTANDDFTVPYTGLYWFGGHLVSSYYISGFYLWKTVSGTTTSLTTAQGGIDTPYGYAQTSNLRLSLTAGDVITWIAANSEGSADMARGSSDKNKSMCNWYMVRRD